jgi:colicin import membrane protein
MGDQAKIVEQMQEISRKDNLLVEEYRQRIEALSGVVNEYKAAADQNEELTTKITELTTITESQKSKLNDLQGDLKTLQEVKEEQMHQQNERHQEALERLAERKTVEKERELLAIRSEYQDKLEKAHDEANGKIRELYEQLERLRNSHEQQIREIQQPKKMTISKSE